MTTVGTSSTRPHVALSMQILDLCYELDVIVSGLTSVQISTTKTVSTGHTDIRTQTPGRFLYLDLSRNKAKKLSCRLRKTLRRHVSLGKFIVSWLVRNVLRLYQICNCLALIHSILVCRGCAAVEFY